MGFGDFFKKVASTTAKVLDTAAKNIEYKKRIDESKREILSRFTVKQLERIATSKGIPLYTEDILTGEKTRLRSKPDIVKRISSNLNFQEVVDLARRYKIRYADIVQELEEFRQKLFGEEQKGKRERDILEDIYDVEGELETESEQIIRMITDFEPMGIVSKEEDLKFQLAQWLAARLGKNAVKIEYPFEHGKIDILVNDSVAIELKIANGKQKLKNLLGEVQTDKVYFSSVIAVVFDVGRDVGLNFFEKQIRALGAKAVIIPAQVKKKGRKQEIIIKQGRKRIIIR